MPSRSFRATSWNSAPDIPTLSVLKRAAIMKLTPQQQHQPKMGSSALSWNTHAYSLLSLALLVGLFSLAGELQTCWKLITPESISSSSPSPNHTVLAPPIVDVATTPSSELLVEPGDFIYTIGDWDGAPVVLEEFKLIFFTSAKVGCTTWKQLFRRMMGYSDWSVEEWVTLLPYNPKFNGLKYLYHYNQTEASRIMTDPEWTRAIFVRDPKVRFVSAFLDKVMTHHSYINGKCCPNTKDCQDKARQSASAFLELAQQCRDAHWDPQSNRMEDKYWPFINFVGHMENVAHDAETLLRKVGAWDRFGASGWGANGVEKIFQVSAGGAGRRHATKAQDKLRNHLTKEDERALDKWYGPDYAHPVMGIAPMNIFEEQEVEAAT